MLVGSIFDLSSEERAPDGLVAVSWVIYYSIGCIVSLLHGLLDPYSMSCISAIVSLGVPRSRLLYVGISDAPEAEPHGQTAASQREPVGSFVAFKSFGTRPLSVMDVRVMIVNMAI